MILTKKVKIYPNEVSNNVTKQEVKDACNSYKRFFKRFANKLKFKNREKRLKQISKKYEMNKIKKEGGERCQFIKTKNIEKLENTIRLIHRKLSNIRNNYLHQVTTSIVKTIQGCN